MKKHMRFLTAAAIILLFAAAAVLAGVGREIPPAWQLCRYDLYVDNMRHSGRHHEAEVTDREIKARLAWLLAAAEPIGEEREPVDVSHAVLHDMLFRLAGEKGEYVVYLEGTEDKLDIYSAGRYSPVICIEKKGSGRAQIFALTAAEYADLIDLMFIPIFGGE